MADNPNVPPNAPPAPFVPPAPMPPHVLALYPNPAEPENFAAEEAIADGIAFDGSYRVDSLKHPLESYIDAGIRLGHTTVNELNHARDSLLAFLDAGDAQGQLDLQLGHNVNEMYMNAQEEFAEDGIDLQTCLREAIEHQFVDTMKFWIRLAFVQKIRGLILTGVIPMPPLPGGNAAGPGAGAGGRRRRSRKTRKVRRAKSRRGKKYSRRH